MGSNAELHRTFDTAFGQGDLAAMRDLLAEDLVLHVPGDSPIAGSWHGRDGFFEWLDLMNQMTGGQLSYEHRQTLDNETHSVAVASFSAARGGKTLDVDVADICRWENGKVVEEWIVVFDQKRADAFWS